MTYKQFKIKRMKENVMILLVILAGLLLCTYKASAQVKKDTTKKPVFEKFVKLSLEDVNQYFGILSDYRRLTTYDPNFKGKGNMLINIQTSLDAYIKSLQERLKVDSVKVEGGKK